MGKHDRAKHEKQQRNMIYAKLHRQLQCPSCGHRTSVLGTCPMCKEKITRGDYAKKLREPH